MGGHSGGGQSGKVDYPEYLKEFHKSMLGGDKDQADWPVEPWLDTYTMEIMNDLWGDNPYTTMVVTPATNYLSPGAMIDWDNFYNIDTAAMLADANAVAGAFDTALGTDLSQLRSYINSINTEAGVDAELAAYDNGMSNINAVHSSSFIIGHQLLAQNVIAAKIQGYSQVAALGLDKAKSKIGAVYDFKSHYHDMISKLRWDVVRLKVERARIYYLMEREVQQDVNEINVKKLTWDMDVMKFGGEIMAGIANIGGSRGGTLGPNKTASTISGALSGAAMGAQIGSKIPAIGPGYGAAGGAIAGAIAGSQA